LQDRFRPVRRGARLGHAGKKKKEGAARWGQSVSRIEREGWGARGLRGNGERSRVGPEEEEGKEWAFGLNREKKGEVLFFFNFFSILFSKALSK
jgi:hypothetical protein